nr:MAG TPA: hypothetical protein [Caudoviricetes sp.]
MRNRPLRGNREKVRYLDTASEIIFITLGSRLLAQVATTHTSRNLNRACNGSGAEVGAKPVIANVYASMEIT